MAYPVVAGPYGFKPVGLIGGQHFSGSTREYPIAYNYGTSIYAGDFVQLTSTAALSSGTVAILANTITGSVAVGVFLGCSFTNPITKQKQWSQYYPANTLAGDIVAIVCDDPDVVYRCVVVASASSNVIASGSAFLVGQNVAGNTNTGSATSGVSSGGVVGAVSSTGNFRVLAQVPETQIKYACTPNAVYSATATTVVLNGLPVGANIPTGSDLYQNLNGQLQYLGALTGAASVTASQSFTITALPTSTVATTTTTPLIVVQTPEVLVKVTFGAHRYYVA